MTKLIVNCETGETLERELNDQELAQQEIDQARALEIKAKAEAHAQAKVEAEAKLAKLGLTTDDLRALGL